MYALSFGKECFDWTFFLFFLLCHSFIRFWYILYFIYLVVNYLLFLPAVKRIKWPKIAAKNCPNFA